MRTIAQIILNSEAEYISYDFVGRKIRRKRAGISLSRDICKDNLFDVKKVFDKHGIRFWFLYGTLLGAIREGDFIKHDTDTDVGIYEKDREKFILILKELVGMGFNLIRTKAPDDLATIMRNDEYIDFGLFREGKDESGDKYWFYQVNRVYGSLEPLKPYKFLGKEFLIPNEAEKLLGNWYGSNWGVTEKKRPARHPELIE